ncbi:MAG TPA: BON domain-containing protein [Candidatus Angelobacter sp.]|jgi:osmotically-inducible protein OsmY
MHKLTIATLLWLFPVFAAGFQSTGQTPTSTPTQSNGPGSSDQGGPRIQDTIQSAIQKDPALSSADVTVDVKNGKHVELNGTVPSKDAKDAAERIAKENSGGIKVKNHLKVAPSGNKAEKSGKLKGDANSPKK